jgi:outer membrane protein assembly factor BamB
VYVFGYDGTGPDLQEYLVCLDEQSGKEIWKHGFNDFLSDIVYDRYSIGSPAVDPETGQVYLLTTAGEFVCFTGDGELLWKHSMMEDFGRLTFPNGRTGAPVIDGDLVIVQAITSNWGSEGPGRNRYYAFDKKNGGLVWSSTPGIQPVDSSFATPIFDWQGEKRVFYSGTGDGNIVCVNARTGEPIWRYHISSGGINSSCLIHEGKVIALHGNENVDSSDTGRMVAVKLGAEPGAGEEAPKVLDRSWEVWRNPELSMFSSSPILVGDDIFQVVSTGELFCVDASTGETRWKRKLATDQLHASPLYADGKLYIPMQNGKFFILKPGSEDAEVLCEVQLEGNALGSPAI